MHKEMSMEKNVLVTFLLLMASLCPIQAVQYQVLNYATGTPGGTRFDNEIGVLYGGQILQLASEFIWQTFKQNEGEGNIYQEILLIVESYNGGAAYRETNKIHVSSEYIASFVGDVRIEIIGVLYHETTHIWQWHANGEAPQGLIEGIADYVRLKAGWAPSHWVSRGTGNRWDEGYTVTAYFLEYCNGLQDGFVAALNGLMKDGYSDDYFVQLLGKNVDDLWMEYKAQYST